MGIKKILKAIWDNLKGYFIVGTGIIVLLTLFFYFNGFIIYDKECYEDIAIQECPGQEVNLYKEFADSQFSFRCCDYSEIDNNSRNKWDHLPNCNTYIYLEKDHHICGDKYVRFKQVW